MLEQINEAVAFHRPTIEMIAVIMRIISFSIVSWLGPTSPFFFVWALNTVDAIALSWCAVLRKDRAYTLLNVFWIGVGAVGMIRSSSF